MTRFLTVSGAFILLACFLLVNQALADDGFPGRKLYPIVTTLSKEELHAKMANDEVVVVDVRSSYEYKTLKILNAVNIPVAEKSFHEQLAALRKSTDKAIVFYCNGRTCYKSYKAGVKALNYNVKNCFSYDAGVFEWALSYPELSVLLNQTPIKTDSIISKENFESRLLTVEDFSKRSLVENSIIYDVRDREQRRGGSGLYMFRDKHVDLDNIDKLDKIISRAKENNTTLFFYDQKGKQVRWLQYYLENNGLKDYYFMKGGAGAYYAMLRKQQES